MHAAALQLSPILAAEKSKVPFYIAGGLLVVWALTLSLVLGMRKPDFPGSLSGQRAVTAVTAVLVLAAVSTAVLTSEPPAKSAAATPVAGAERGAPTPAPASSSGAATAPAATSTAATPATPQTGARTSLGLAANPSGQLAYNTKTLSAKAGTVTITMTNMSPLEHNVTIASGSTVLAATPTFAGGSRSVTLTLRPGTYTFYCSVPGHRQAGMEGTLTVSS
ncbi:MAG TPA: plastocyanin/azurin family copper-binding protein [Solirubrobacteraceae bacterium]|nr:plastocyanin/azurin family copper-binding protein [Solirubrobacteraceae bacterium]